MPASETADHVFKAIVEERMVNVVKGNNPHNPFNQ
jgi:hypothetical protein